MSIVVVNDFRPAVLIASCRHGIPPTADYNYKLQIAFVGRGKVLLLFHIITK